MMGEAVNLRYIVLTGNEITYEPCAALLATVVNTGSELRVLDLSKNPLGTRGGLAVAESDPEQPEHVIAAKVHFVCKKKYLFQ